MFLLEGGSNIIDASVAVEEERAGVVGDRVPVRVDLSRRGRYFARSVRTMASMAGVRTNFTPCFRSEVMDRILLAMSAISFLE